MAAKFGRQIAFWSARKASALVARDAKTGLPAAHPSQSVLSPARSRSRPSRQLRHPQFEGRRQVDRVVAAQCRSRRLPARTARPGRHRSQRRSRQGLPKRPLPRECLSRVTKDGLTPTEDQRVAHGGEVAVKRGRAWKLERAVVHKRGGGTRSNRYSHGDGPEPKPHSRKMYWHPGNGRLQRNPHYKPGA